MHKNQILPLAITKIDDEESCVAGILDNNTWIRPETIHVNDIENGLFKYGFITDINFSGSISSEPRIEDRQFIREINALSYKVEDSEIQSRIESILDESIDKIFTINRTVGIIRTKIRDIVYGRTFGGKKNFRAIFDDVDKSYNLIIVDLTFKNMLQSYLVNDELPIDKKQEIIDAYNSKQLYLAIALTRPTSYPGIYGGCHPLVVGIHSF